MYQITVYSRDSCLYCEKLKNMLGIMIAYERGLLELHYKEWNSDVKERIESEYDVEIKTIPQIFVNGEYIGGYSQFISWCRLHLFNAMCHYEDYEF